MSSQDFLYYLFNDPAFKDIGAMDAPEVLPAGGMFQNLDYWPGSDGTCGPAHPICFKR